MNNVKTWLDTNYPKNERKNVTELLLNDKDLEGSLDLTWEEFPKLERVWYHHELKIITNYDLKIAELLGQKAPVGFSLKTEVRVEVEKYVPAQDILEKLYSKSSWSGITKLDLTQKGLKGSLDLTGFTNLEELTLNMDNPWGRKYADSNYITELKLNGLKKITKLTLTNNPKEKKLEDLVTLTALTKLDLSGHSYENPAQWVGSLEKINALKNLTELDISHNPAIQQGLESLEKLEKLECKGTVYEKQLKGFDGDVKSWKIILFPEKVSSDKDTLIQKINEYLSQTHDSLNGLNKRQLTDTDLEKKIEILEARNREILK